MLATAVWIGGLVVIFVVARVATRALRPPERIELFRGLGRAYGPLGGLALAVALMSGAALLSGHPWNGQVTAATAVAGALVAVTVAGVLQARRMTRLRRSALRHPGSPRLRRPGPAGSDQRRHPPRPHRRPQPRAPSPRSGARRMTTMTGNTEARQTRAARRLLSTA